MTRYLVIWQLKG